MSKRPQANHLSTVKCIFCVAMLVMGAHAAFAIQDQSSGPALGTTIDLGAWRSRDGRTLAEVIKGHSLAMVLLVDPRCEKCAASKDDFRSLRERVGQPGIPYYVLMIPEGTDTQKYFSYSDSLKLGDVSFVWSSTETKPPSSLATMAVPSHLLLTNEGLVVNKWPGTQP